MVCEERTLWIHLKFVGLQTSQQYLPLFGNYLHFSYTAIKQNEGSRLAAPGEPLAEACACSRSPGQLGGLLSMGTAGPTTHRPRSHPFLLFIFFLKALFLRLQKTQPQKPIRAIKKRHKLASSNGFEKTKPAPAGSHFCFCPVFSLNARPLGPQPGCKPSPHTALVQRQARAIENVLFKKVSYKMSGLQRRLWNCG